MFSKGPKCAPGLKAKKKICSPATLANTLQKGYLARGLVGCIQSRELGMSARIAFQGVSCG